MPLEPRPQPMPPYTVAQISYFDNLTERVQELLEESEQVKEGLDEAEAAAYDAADAATTAAQSVQTAIDAATTAAGTANTAATNANTKAQAADTAASSATTAAGSATSAASAANTAATNAGTAAASANTAASAANTAAGKLDNMDTATTTLTPGSQATSSLTLVNGHYRLNLGIPSGANGTNGTNGTNGIDATINTTVTDYQVSTVGNVVPSGTWVGNMPVTPQGQYLWMRTRLNWSTGSTTTLYTVSRMGIDGVGQIITVNHVAPDASGNIEIPINTDVWAQTNFDDVVHVANAAALPLIDMTITIEAVQSGSGDPSSSNIRPITGWTGATISQAAEENPAVPEDIEEYTISWQT